MIAAPAWLHRTWVAIYVLGFIAVWRGYADSGTLEHPNHIGMVVASVFLVSVFWCWVAGVRFLLSRLKPSWWRPVPVLLLILTGWLAGPLAVLALQPHSQLPASPQPPTAPQDSATR